ncbi:MAG TPA: phosphoglucomutase/phosphomannomutase family protein [Anaerolineales bacterium]|nr:phosphoglucomutase/phosphomannomutase family protein [Anaerolineales bacterium]
MPIHFGTDGWRAVISDTFTFSNLRMVAQAIADAAASSHWSSGFSEEIDLKKFVVGFDTRFLSDRYATEVSRVLAANGYKVLLAQSDSPTPAISFAVKNNHAAGGVMITASHNAPRYNGVKLKAAYGGSALPEQCRNVEVYINDNEELARGPNLMDYQLAKDTGLIVKFNPLPAYFEHLRTLINTDIIAENPQRFVIDSMYGSGRGVIRSFLQGSGCEITEVRGEMNPGFGGTHPEPIEKNLGALMGAIGTGLGSFGLATDGDADRIGAMDEKGAFVDPHKIMALSLKYLYEVRGLRGAAVRTVSTTRMIDRLAKKYGIPVYETPVGFNHIADYMLAQDILIGGEESGGISFKGHLPEGDGPIMGLLLVEMIAHYNKSLGTLVNELLSEVGPAHYKRIDLRLARPVAKKEMVSLINQNAPAKIGSSKVNEISNLDGVKFIMEDDSWLLIRPSGTEPVLRVYAEARNEELLNDLMEYGRKVANSIV